MLTNMLPNNGSSPGLGNGTYKLHAIARNTAGAALDLGTKAITVDNAHAIKPFGTIDTPSQGGTISGSAYANFGWALTPNPNLIPIDGSTITVMVDGAALGHPAYNQYRSDVANLFPGLANSNGAVGFFLIDTTKLSNGIHTISWVANDNVGHVDGLGSRYFNVFNTTGGTAAPEEPPQMETVEGVTWRRGYEPIVLAEERVVDREGLHSLSVEELDRIELKLGVTAGYLVVRGERRRLPIGSTLNAGVFRWQLGPAFLGEYNLEFEKPNADPIRVRVNVRPKNYSAPKLRQ